MNLDQLKNTLHQVGYNSKLLSSGTLRIGKSLGQNQDGLNLFRFYCDIDIVDNEIIATYGRTNLQDTITFNTQSRLLKWIKQEFPI